MLDKSILSKVEMIECPHCKAQYLPVEIFIPNVFFGRPTHIEKNSQGKVTDIIGSYTNSDEHFICDYCNKPFKVITKLQFSTKSEDKFDFDNDYATQLKKESIFLSED